jgi:magnesium transporter
MRPSSQPSKQPSATALPATAASAAAAAVPRADPTEHAGDVRTSLMNGLFEIASDVAVVDGERLVGLAPIERVLSAADSTLVADLAEPPVTAYADEDLEAAARTLARGSGRCIGVIDRTDRFLGLVPAQRLLQLLEAEHEEDLARLGGFLAGASQARSAAHESVRRRLWHRLPWLALGLIGAMASAVVVGAFEEEIRKEVLLAFFVPAVVYMADAVGTQTETVVIRGMALGIGIRSVFARELAGGLVIGALLGASFFFFVLAAWDEMRVAAAVALGLGISCSIASLVAMALPYGLARLGRDPAYGSGPLATVIQDLLSILAYFAVASLLLA